MKPAFLKDKNHGAQACSGCHGGNPKAEARADAHKGLTRDPSWGTTNVCASCHKAIAQTFATSLHATLAGEKQSMIWRSGATTLNADLTKTFGNHCASCHSSCGDCHMSVPHSAGGGFLAGHMVKRTPPLTRVCAACHGSRVSDEYTGGNKGVKADIHYSKGIQCTQCHTGDEMHGKGQAAALHRYAITNAPRCANCHPDDAAFKKTTAHTMHRDAQGALKLSCQVCHAQPYKSCYSCHVQLKNGSAVYEVNAPSHESLITFKIGKNPLQDALHPAKWVTLRHAPIDPNNYDYYQKGLLTTFDAKPTWHLATPHNIQRITPQNKGCTATCHGQRDLFLAPADLKPYEIKANASVIVPDSELPQ